MSVRLYAMTCGWIAMGMNTFLKGEKGYVAVPVPCYVIDHPKGIVQFDTGLTRDISSTDVLVREQALGNRARSEVVGAACGTGHNHANGPVGIPLRKCADRLHGPCGKQNDRDRDADHGFSSTQFCDDG